MFTRKKKWLHAKIRKPKYNSSINPIITKKISFNELVQIKTIPSRECRESLIEEDLVKEIWYSSIDYYLLLHEKRIT